MMKRLFLIIILNSTSINLLAHEPKLIPEYSKLEHDRLPKKRDAEHQLATQARLGARVGNHIIAKVANTDPCSRCIEKCRNGLIACGGLTLVAATFAIPFTIWYYNQSQLTSK